MIARLLPGEEEGILDLAARLGVEAPLEGAVLRKVDGRCVFLDQDDRCRIHARFGAAAKPVVCRQYPVVAVLTEAGARIGLDPGCYATWQVWQDGPEVDVSEVLPGSRSLPAEAAVVEQQVLALLGRPGATVGGSLRGLAGGDPGTPSLPGGFAGRLVERLQAADLAARMAKGLPGPAVTRRFEPLLAAIPAWSPANPPVLALPDDSERFALEVARRMVFLRMGPPGFAPPVVALLALSGAVAMGWLDPSPLVLGPALAAWAQVMRTRAFAGALLPDQAALARLVAAG